jgi:hypothetical protein
MQKTASVLLELVKEAWLPSAILNHHVNLLLHLYAC